VLFRSPAGPTKAEKQVPRGLSDSKQLGVYVTLSYVGLEMVAPVLLGLYLDHQFDWMPWGTIGGAVFGLVGGMMHLIAILNRPKDSGPSQRPRDEV